MDIIQIFTHSPLRNFSYLIYSKAPDKTEEVVCVDPFDADQILSHLKEHRIKLTKIINTHGHYDHTSGNAELKKKTGASIYSTIKAQGKFPFDFVLNQAQEIALDSQSSLMVVETPGHTDCHLSLIGLENKNPMALFCGDTLFNAGVGNCKNGGNVEILYSTISQIIQALPDEVKVYPGHDYWMNNLKFTLKNEPSNTKAQALLNSYDQNNIMVSSMGLERSINTFLRLDNSEIRKHLNLETATEREVFIKLRSLRDHW